MPINTQLTKEDSIRLLEIKPGFVKNDRSHKYFLDFSKFKIDDSDVSEYFNDYLNSKGFQRIINNQNKWWEKRHPFRKWYSNPDLGTKNWFQIANRKEPRIIITDDYPEKSFTSTPPGENSTLIVGNRYSEKFPFWFTLAHEYTHGKSPRNQFVEIHNFNHKSALREALEQNKNTEQNNHDNLLYEKHADIWGLKYLLYKEGIYDSRSDKDITEKEVQKLREKYPDLRPLKQMNNKEVVFQLNHVAMNNQNINLNTLYAKKGQKLIPKHQKPSKPLTKKVEIEDELPEEEIETSEEVNEPIVRVVGVPKRTYIPEITAPFILGSSHWNEFESDKLNFHWPVDKAGNKIDATIPKQGGENNSEKAINNFLEIKDYWHGPVAEARLKNLGFNDELYKELVLWIDSMKIFTTGGPHSSYAYPLDNKIGINVEFPDVTAPETGITDVNTAVSHEMAHNIYPRMRFIMLNSDQERTNFVDFNEHLHKMNVTHDKAEKVYRGSKYFQENPLGWELKPGRRLTDGDLEHDKNIREYAPFVYELREAARLAGIWDYTSGEPLTRKKFGELINKFPQSRLINYTDPDNAIWLLNTTASNDTNNKLLNDTETFYAKKGKKLISKNIIKHE